MAMKLNKDVTICVSDEEFRSIDKGIETGDPLIESPVKPHWSPIRDPGFPPCPFMDAIPVYAGQDDTAYEIVGEQLFFNGKPYGKFDDSWTFIGADMNSGLNQGSANVVDKQDFIEATVAKKERNNGGVSSSTSATGTGNHDKTKNNPKTMYRLKFSIPRCSQSCMIVSCCQIVTIALILFLVYLPLNSELVPRPPAQHMSGGLDDSFERIDLKKELEMALSVDKTADQDRYEWELENSPDIPIEHLDHHEYQIGNENYIDHDILPDIV